MNKPEHTETNRLSVILPNYDHAAFLPRALDALLSQSRPAEEILVVDDASTDHSLTVIERYVARHPSVRLLRHERNQGALAALQHGLESAQGRYVYFAAADDCVLPGFFETGLRALEQNPVCGLFCADAVLVDGETGETIGFRPAIPPKRGGGALRPHEVARLLRRADNFILTGSALFRRDLALGKGGFQKEAGSFADGMLARRIALSHGLCYAPMAAAVWYVFDSSLSRTTASDAGVAQSALEKIPALYGRYPDVPQWYPDLARRRWRFNAARLALLERPPRTSVVDAVAAPTPLDRAVVAILKRLLPCRGGITLMLAWFALRFRPMGLRGMLEAMRHNHKRAIEARAQSLDLPAG